jgi:hypothetical protein
LAVLDGVDLMEARLDRQAAAPGEAIRLDVLWRVREAPGRDLAAFVHLGDPSQQPLAQGDSPPLGGSYRTGLWETGEVIADAYSLTIPPGLAAGSYPVYVGLYDPQGGRVPLLAGGSRLPGDAYPVGEVSLIQ